MITAPKPTRIDLAPPPDEARPTAIWIGRGLATLLAEELSSRPLADRYALLTDARVGALYAAPIEAALRDAGIRVDRMQFAGGEPLKTRGTKAELEDRMVAAGIGRDGAILALGGGVVGDLAGFIAATYHRGIPWIAMPTTLLASVDAAIGGKTGVDLPAGKNLVGAFHPPAAVYADLAALDTLPDERLREGFAEVLKHALVADAALAASLEAEAAALLARSREPLHRIVCASVRVKTTIVSQDPREAGLRAILNFGHTVAHALESASGYALSHGEAVGIGLAVEADLSASVGSLPAADAARIRRLLAAFGLPTSVPPDLDPEDLVERCRRDKKVRRGEVRCALLRRIGEAAGSEDGWTFTVPASRLLEALVGSRTRGRS